MVAVPAPERLPIERRARQGGMLFLVSLGMFFFGSIGSYLLYATWRRETAGLGDGLPREFLASTVLLLVVSLVLHGACRAIRRERRRVLLGCLGAALLCALAFMMLQGWAMYHMVEPILRHSALGTGVGAMVFVLAALHALHVAPGIVALGVVTARSLLGRYDHERTWAIDFTAHYWHFLDGVWLCMLLAFWLTSPGFTG